MKKYKLKRNKKLAKRSNNEKRNGLALRNGILKNSLSEMRNVVIVFYLYVKAIEPYKLSREAGVPVIQKNLQHLLDFPTI